MTTSLATLQKDLEEIKPMLKEILQRLEENDTRDIIEAAAAKIILEIKRCPCNTEIIDALEKSKDNQIIIRNENRPGRLYQYSYPNNNVGNEELGTGKNLKSISWPPEQ